MAVWNPEDNFVFGFGFGLEEHVPMGESENSAFGVPIPSPDLALGPVPSDENLALSALPPFRSIESPTTCAATAPTIRRPLQEVKENVRAPPNKRNSLTPPMASRRG